MSEKKNPDLILMYFAGLASSKGGVGGWGVTARGSGSKQTSVLEVFMLLQKISLSLKFSLLRAKKRRRGKQA